ncbi:MAG: ATP-grasp domain-containing protein [Myxococcota bacterium]
MTQNVVFAAPFPAEVTQRFARAARQLDGVRLLGLVHTAPQEPLYHDVERVAEPLNPASLRAGVEALARRHGRIDRIVGILEALQVQLAELRRDFGVPGTKPEIAEIFRDKAKMKAVLSKAGLPVARSRMVDSRKAAFEFAEQVGFPFVLKPPAGMGAKSTFRVTSGPQLDQALKGLGARASGPMLAEEFLTGREHSFETITVGGQVRLSSASDYFPTCLEAVENPWIQWACLLPRDISGEEYEGVEALGKAAIAALGLHQGVTHMEWFRRPDGSVAIGEIALRPPGANISLMTGVAHGMDMYRAWARAEIDGAFDGPYVRQKAVGSAFLRGMGGGRVASVRGIKEISERASKYLVEAQLPVLGAAKKDTYEGDGYIVVADEDTEVVKGLLHDIVNTVRVSYS